MMNAFRTNPTPMTDQRGLSLVELMVALVLGLIVTAGIIQLFLGTKLTFNSNEALARVQENGRFALEQLKPIMRESGTHGICAADIAISSHLNTGCSDEMDTIFADDQAFLAWEFNGTGRNEGFTIPDDLDPSGQPVTNWSSVDADGTALDLPAMLAGRVVPGSDVFIIRRLRVLDGVTATGTSSGSSPITLDESHGLDAGALMLVTNCTTGADLFHNTGGASEVDANAGTCGGQGPGNRGLDWSTGYDPTMQVYEVQVHGYYVGFDADRGEPGLYRVDLSEGSAGAVHEELVGGVENMQVLAGYSLPADQGGDGQRVDNWLEGDLVPDWQFVIGARVSLLMRSPDNADTEVETRTFDLGGAAVTSSQDARLRQPFTATFSLRNRQLVL
jgi:type IV pilus assembly protein PilW